ncbi:MucBP domain-containing protein [Streptococcus merionis]|uniref:MucBP domain-containing protein n=1 Tax=Streptococcus merionis TaxID=400065 RepID=UPI0026F28C98|nr:MucBP domain-containing protein [Streptococcus merionis]
MQRKFVVGILLSSTILSLSQVNSLSNALVSANTEVDVDRVVEVRSGEIAPFNLTYSVSGSDRQSAALTDGSEITHSSVQSNTVQFELPDYIKAGSTTTFTVPEHLSPVAGTIAITDYNGVHLGDVVISGNQVKITYSDAFETRQNNAIKFTFTTTANRDTWTEYGSIKPMEIRYQDTVYSGNMNLKLHVSTTAQFSTSTSLFVTINKPYEFWQGSEFGSVTSEVASYRVVYKITNPDKHLYDVNSINEKGFNIRIGLARNNNQLVNTKHNNLGITAVASEDGTEVVLNIPNMPANFGMNGGMIPTLLTDEAILETYADTVENNNSEWFKSSMTVYVNDELKFTRNAQAKYPYANADGGGAATAILVVKYVNEDGEELKPSTTTRYKVGDPYSTNPEVIDGYELIEQPKNASGKISEHTEVVYVYRKIIVTTTTEPTTTSTTETTTTSTTTSTTESTTESTTTSATESTTESTTASTTESTTTSTTASTTETTTTEPTTAPTIETTTELTTTSTIGPTTTETTIVSKTKPKDTKSTTTVSATQNISDVSTEPSSSKGSLSSSKKKVLPSTGDAVSVLTILSGLTLGAVSFFGMNRKKD